MKLVAATMFTASIFTLASVAGAETYQTELSGIYGETNSDFFSTDNYEVGVLGTRYFSAVDTTRGPLAKAAFLQKASYVRAYLGNRDYESKFIDGDSYARAVQAIYFIPNTLFFVGAGVTQYKSSYNYTVSGDGWTYENEEAGKWESQWNATLGFAPLDNLHVWSDFAEDVDVSDYWNLNAEYLRLLANERAVGVTVEYDHDSANDTRSFDVNVDYYFTPRTSLGLGVVRFSDGDSSDDDRSSSIRARQFLTQNASIEVAYYTADYSDRWQVGATFRF